MLRFLLQGSKHGHHCGAGAFHQLFSAPGSGITCVCLGGAAHMQLLGKTLHCLWARALLFASSRHGLNKPASRICCYVSLCGWILQLSQSVLGPGAS